VHVGDTVALLSLGEPGPIGDGTSTRRIVKLFVRAGAHQAEARGDRGVSGLAGVEIGKAVSAPDHLERLEG
jgi:hypothetical protein